MSSTYSREVQVAKELAERAGRLALRYRGGELEIELKPGDEPVTVADLRASELIVSGLSREFPDDVVISEENADDLRRLSAERVWYIDPIDGTKDFIHGHEGFSVMIGLTVGHRPVIGVVYQPVGERMFWSDGERAYFSVSGQTEEKIGQKSDRESDHSPRVLTVSKVADASDIRLVASRSHRSKKLDQVKSALGIRSELNIGSVGLKLCLIALAERDLYVNPSSHCKVWDTCAPEAILRAAGGEMTDIHGALLPYNREDLRRRRGLVASNSLIHGAVIKRLSALFPGEASPDSE